MAGDSFFAKPSSSKRKRPAAAAGASRSSSSTGRPTSSSKPSPAAAAPKRTRAKRDEELASDDDGGEDANIDDMDLTRDTRGGESDDEEREADRRETGGEKRLRIAREYLRGLEAEQQIDDGSYDAATIDREIMAARLQTDILSHSPKMHLHVSALLSALPAVHFLPLPSLPPTAARVAPGSPYLYTASKSGAIAKFSLPTGTLTAHFARAGRPDKTGKKGKGRERASTLGTEVQPQGHQDEIWDLALSQDGRFLVSGGKDGVVGVWDVAGAQGKWLRGLKGHRDSITSLSFQLGTENFYTASLDRTISIFSTSTLSHLESLYGHQDASPSVSALRGENVVSAGARDRTVRFWKVADESQLVFRGGGASKGVWEDDDDVVDEQERRAVVEGREGEGRAKRERRKRREVKQKERFREGSIDCVAMVDEQHFISGGDSGAVALWSITKKKPVFIEHLAHGVHAHESESEGKIGTARWITAVACLPYGDTFATGSWDGTVRVWALARDLKSFKLLLTIPAKGFVNSLQLIVPSAGQVDFSRFRSGAPAAAAVTNGANGHDGDGVVNGDAAAPLAKAEDEHTTEEPDAKLGLLLVATTAQEPRLGRWLKLARADGVRNGVVLAHLKVAGQAELDERQAEKERERERVEAERAVALEVDME